VVVNLLCCIPLVGEESFYARLSSLTTTNDSGPTAGDPRLADEGALNSGDIAGIKIGMTMSDVVEHWGKPKLIYSTCMGGPRIDYTAAALFFRDDALSRVYLKSPANREITNSPSLLTTNQTASEYFKRFLSLIDKNNKGPFVTNSIPHGNRMTLKALAGISEGMRMSEIIQAWGKPLILWSDRFGKGTHLGYNDCSLYFEGEKLKEIWYY